MVQTRQRHKEVIVGHWSDRVGRRIMSYICMTIYVCILSNLISGIASADSPTFDSYSIQVEQGKGHLDKLEALSQMTSFGECWKSALSGLTTSCKGLNEETQARMALKFTACFNEMTHLPTFLCGDEDPIDRCIKSLDSTGINTFRDFFLQTQHMCFYIQSEIWREANDRTINKLTNTATMVEKNLKESEEKQNRILESQQHSEKMQSGILKDQTAVFNVLVRLKDIFDDFRVSVEDHRMIFSEIFEKLTKTQKLVSWIQGEMSLLDMMGFYFISLVFGFIATATPRTRHARFWMVCLAIISLASERALYSYLDQSANFSPEQIQEWIWILRRMCCLCGVLLLIWSAANYRDYQAVNNNLLAQLHSRMEILVEFVQELARTGVQVPPQLLNEIKSGSGEESETNLPECEMEEDDVSEISSADTYSNYTDDSETENELADISIPGGTVAVASQKKPLFERFFGSSRVDNNGRTSPARVGMSNPSRSATPPMSPERHGYFLRERRTPLRENSVLSSESPTMFANTVKKTKKRIQGKTVGDRRSQYMNYFSSDEEF